MIATVLVGGAVGLGVFLALETAALLLNVAHNARKARAARLGGGR